jgi:protein arginine phosphatase
MAEGLLRSKLAQDGLAGQFAVASAGVWTTDDRPATGHAVQVMAERGIDISAHRSRNVTAEIVEEAALILAMTRNHVEAMQLEFPLHAGRVHLLSEMSERRRDVDDPIGGTLADYEATAKDLEGLIQAGYKKILEMVSTS